MEKVRFLYNQASGTTSVADHLDEIIGVYQRRGYQILPLKITFDQIDEEVLNSDSDLHHILIAGGDGTINYVVNVLKNNGIKTPIAVLPTGTANDFASVLGMPSNIVEACRRILSGEIRKIDLGHAGEKYFVNIFSCGLLTEVSQKTPTVLKNVFGKVAYYFSSIGELPKFKRLNINLHSEHGSFEGQSLVFFVFNGQTAGKIRLAYMSELDDGLLDVIVVKTDNIVESIAALAHFMRRGGKSYPPGIIHFKTDKLYVDSLNNESTDIDGQAGPGFPVEITCEKHAIEIICPKTKIKK